MTSSARTWRMIQSARDFMMPWQKNMTFPTIISSVRIWVTDSRRFRQTISRMFSKVLKYPRSHRRNSHYNHSRQQLWTAAMQKRAMTNRRQHTTNNMPRHIINLPKKVGLGWE